MKPYNVAGGDTDHGGARGWCPHQPQKSIGLAVSKKEDDKIGFHSTFVSKKP